MLQSIQYIGSGSPTYVYSEKATSTSDMFFRVFAAEASGYRSQRDRKNERRRVAKHEIKAEAVEAEKQVLETPQDVQEVYKKEYGRRESFLWKQR